MTILEREVAVLELMKLENEMRRLLADNKRLLGDKEALLAALKGLCEADRDDLNDSESSVWSVAVNAIARAEGRAS